MVNTRTKLSILTEPAEGKSADDPKIICCLSDSDRQRTIRFNGGLFSPKVIVALASAPQVEDVIMQRLN